jgi:hypothetical protein
MPGFSPVWWVDVRWLFPKPAAIWVSGPGPRLLRSYIVGITDEVKRKGLELLGDPRVTKLMQSEQFMKAVLVVAQMPEKVSEFTAEQSDRFAKVARLPTTAQFEALELKVRQLEEELGRLRLRLERLDDSAGTP